MTPKSPLTPAALALIATLFGLTACSSGSPDETCPAPTAAPAADLSLMPEGLSLEGVGTVTKVVSTQGHISVRAVTDQPIDEVTVAIQDAVTAAGFRPAGMDNEGFEAEVFFTSGSYAAGQALVRGANCEGQWDIDLTLVDPTRIPSDSATPTPTGVAPSVSGSSSPSAS